MTDYKLATFGAGCFWGVEAVFRKVEGVIDTAVGYMGGDLENPTYEQVCTDKTSHVEVVQVKFDPSRVSFKELLEIFWNNHDPTTKNRQGPDIGTQYRSVIFHHNEDQRLNAEEMKKSLNKSEKFDRKIVTSIEQALTFWRAEEYHQNYFEKNNIDVSCHL
jgi:peptide-methionine (S)-S-oxide reductase